MKKVYISFASLALCATAMGQNLTKEYNFGAKGAITSPKTEKPAISVKPSVSNTEGTEKVLNVLWTEDFEGTTAMTTAKGVYTATGSLTGVNWDMSSTHPWSAFGWADNLTGRFLKWDSYTPIEAGETEFATTSVTGEVVSPTIDLSGGTNGVILKFKTEAMYCCHVSELPFRISVSQDNGTNWSLPIVIDLGVDRNVATENIAQPMDVQVDLSAYAGTSSTAKFKFIWDSGSADVNGQMNTHYWWLIDDIEIFERPNYNVEVLDLWLNDIDTEYEYTSIPQVFAGAPFTVQAKLKNNGKLDPTGTTLKVEISGPSPSTAVVSTETGGVLSSGFANELDTILFATAINMSGYAIGTYTVKATLQMNETDEDLTDNVYVRTFKITANDYGQRNFEQPLFYGSIGKDNGATATESAYMGFGSVFYIPSDVELHGINMKIGKAGTTYPTTVGEQLFVQLYRIDVSSPIATQADFNAIHAQEAGTSDWLFPITSTMVPAGTSGSKDVTLNFHQSTGSQIIPTLLGGEYYLALVNHDGGAGKHFCYLENPLDADYSTHNLTLDGTLDWGYQFTQIITELNLNPSLDVNGLESELKIGYVAPNPTSGETTVAYSLQSNSDVTIQIVDLTGKVINTITENNLEAGTHFTNFDAAGMSSGVYYVNVKSNNTVVTQKFIKK